LSNSSNNAKPVAHFWTEAVTAVVPKDDKNWLKKLLEQLRFRAVLSGFSEGSGPTVAEAGEARW
jgi:hypothetical protein